MFFHPSQRVEIVKMRAERFSVWSV